MKTLLVKTSIANFSDHMRQGAEHIAKACKIYSDAVANDHTAAYEFEKAFPYITTTTWDKMRLAGCGAMEPKILLLSDRLGAKLIKLPLDEQRRIVCEDIEIIKPSGKTIKKNARNLTETEEVQVFTKTGAIRTASQQKTIIADKSKVVPYAINGNVLNVRRTCVLSLKELKAIVRKMS